MTASLKSKRPRMSNEALLEFRAVSKAFGMTQALDGVSFELRSGETHGFVGKNGAGKSTCIAVISGSLKPDNGQVLWFGTALRNPNPRTLGSAGLAAVYQEVILVPELDVLQNLGLVNGGALSGISMRARRKLEDAVRALMSDLDFEIDLHVAVSRLNLAQRQLVTIIRAAISNPRLVLFDEPTAALGPDECRVFYAIMERLTNQGAGCVLVSHDLDEVRSMCQAISVFRDGRLVGTFRSSQCSSPELLRLMVGSDHPLETTNSKAQDPGVPKRQRFMASGISRLDLSTDSGVREEGSNAGRLAREITAGTAKASYALRTQSLSTGRPKLKDISLQIGTGEIVGLVGLSGAGRSTLFKCMAGAAPARAEAFEVCGEAQQLPASPKKALQLGIGYLPEDRKSEGLTGSLPAALEMTLLELRQCSVVGLLSSRKHATRVDRACAAVSLHRGMAHKRSTELSGGNQQKVILARAISTEPKILLADEPTRGIDISAREEIWSFLKGLAARGCGILVASSDWSELKEHCSRLVVIARGAIRWEGPSSVPDVKLLSLAYGEADEADNGWS